LRQLLLVRHAHAASNVSDSVSCVPPGEGLSDAGLEEALALRETLAHEPVDLGVATPLRRTQETLDIALGAFEGRPLAEYRAWAWTTEPDAECPGGGESRVQAARRVAGALDELLLRPEDLVLAVSHALPIRYVVDASDGSFPAARIVPVPHAVPFRLGADAVERAAETLRAWATAPRFSDSA
jgi:broad specificity phosphatase PhoE